MQKNKFEEGGIHYRRWPIDAPKAVVLIVHGLGEHCERYDAVASTMNQAGYAVESIDLPGHGNSQGTRGFIESFAHFEDAVLSLYQKIGEWHPDKPVFLLGHSMGGLIASHLLLKHQDKFKGALLSGAAIESPQQPPAIQVAIVRLISKLFPKAGVMTLDASGISRDPAVVENYMNDPLVNKGKLSARLLVEMFNSMDECKAGASSISLPVFIMHGSKDDMTSPNGSQLLFDSVSSGDKTIKIYEGLMHEILNEPEGPQITQEIIEWMDAHA